MYLFYETLSESAPDTENSVMSILPCMFTIGVDISEESSGLSIYFYNAVQDKADVISKRSTKYISLDDLTQYGVMNAQILNLGANRGRFRFQKWMICDPHKSSKCG